MSILHAGQSKGFCQPGSLRAIDAPSPCTGTPSLTVYFSFLQTRGSPGPVSPLDPEARSPVRIPENATRHPPPSALPVPGAGRSYRLPAAGAAQGRVASALCKGPEGLGWVVGGGTLFPSPGAPWRGPEGERRKMRSENFYPFAALQTFYSLPALGWAQPPYLSVFCSPAENSSKVILQLQVPHRERAASGLLLPL